MAGQPDQVYIPEDVRANIMSFLPTKAVLRFKRMCRSWYNFTSEEHFINKMLVKPQKLAGFYFQRSHLWPDRAITGISHISVQAKAEEDPLTHNLFNFLPEGVVILGWCCNGLVCCRSISTPPTSSPCSMYICNPATSKWIKLDGSIPNKRSSYGLAFDPCRGMPINFNVVKLSAQVDGEGPYLSFEIYSSQTRPWKISNEICRCNSGFIMNWLTCAGKVISFGVENELSRLISAPFANMHYTVMPEVCIGESGGRLHYIMMSVNVLHVWAFNYVDLTWSDVHFMTLEMLEEGNSQLFNTRKEVTRRAGVELPWMVPLAFKDDILLLKGINKHKHILHSDKGDEGSQRRRRCRVVSHH